MKHLTRTALMIAAVLFTATAAFAVAVKTAPPRIERVSVVVTDRPVRESAVSTPQPSGPTMVAAVPVVVAPAHVAPSAARSAARQEPPSAESVVPRVIKPARPKAKSDDDDDESSDEDSDHEVVRPGVRDEDDSDDSEDDDHDSKRRWVPDWSRDHSGGTYFEGD